MSKASLDLLGAGNNASIPYAYFYPSVPVDAWGRLVKSACKGIEVIAQAVLFVQKIVHTRIGFQIPPTAQKFFVANSRPQKMIGILVNSICIIERDSVRKLMTEVEVESRLEIEIQQVHQRVR